MKLSKIVVLLWYLFGTAIFAMHAVIPPENIVRLVFMGKTGAGKSTSINAFYNFAKNIQWNAYPKLFPIETKHQACNVLEYAGRNAEDHSQGQLGAVTQEPSEYVATGNNLVVNLVDCPGTADPRGVAKDEEITKDIAQFLHKAGEFNAICIVLQGNMNRATAEELYFIEQLKTIIPKNSLDRIFIVLTHTTRISKNVKDYVQSVGLPIDNVFAFDHLALSQEGHIDLVDDEDLADDVKKRWGTSKKAFDKLITKAKRLGKYSTDAMQRICEIKNSTSEKIHAALRKVDCIEQTEIQIEVAKQKLARVIAERANASGNKQSAEQAMREAEVEQQAVEALSLYETYSAREEYPTPHHNTICLQCAVECHPGCGLSYKGSNCTDHLPGCNAMKDGSCAVCPGRCSYLHHRHRYTAWRAVNYTREKVAVKTRKAHAAANLGLMKNNLANKEQDLETKEGEVDQLSSILSDISDSLDQLKLEKSKLQEEIVELYVELGQVSMGSLNFHIGEYYDTCIKRTKNAAERVKLEKDRRFYLEQVALFKQKSGKI